MTIIRCHARRGCFNQKPVSFLITVKAALRLVRFSVFHFGLRTYLNLKNFGAGSFLVVAENSETKVFQCQFRKYNLKKYCIRSMLRNDFWLLLYASVDLYLSKDKDLTKKVTKI